MKRVSICIIFAFLFVTVFVARIAILRIRHGVKFYQVRCDVAHGHAHFERARRRCALRANDVGNGVGVLNMDGKPIPSELMPQADRSVKIKIKFIQRSGFILHLFTS